MKQIKTIYIIRLIETQKVIYVGETSNFKIRQHSHRYQNTAIGKYLKTLKRSEYDVIPLFTTNNPRMEEILIGIFQTYEFGFNKTLDGKTRADYGRLRDGEKKTEAAKKKISKGLTGLTKTAEHKKKIGESNSKPKEPWSEERKAARAAAMTGKKRGKYNKKETN